MARGMVFGGRVDVVAIFVKGLAALAGSTKGEVDLVLESSVRATSIAAASSPWGGRLRSSGPSGLV